MSYKWTKYYPENSMLFHQRLGDPPLIGIVVAVTPGDARIGYNAHWWHYDAFMGNYSSNLTTRTLNWVQSIIESNQAMDHIGL